jgi:hypothetical protein
LSPTLSLQRSAADVCFNHDHRGLLAGILSPSSLSPVQSPPCSSPLSSWSSQFSDFASELDDLLVVHLRLISLSKTNKYQQNSSEVRGTKYLVKLHMPFKALEFDSIFVRAWWPNMMCCVRPSMFDYHSLIKKISNSNALKGMWSFTKYFVLDISERRRWLILVRL